MKKKILTVLAILGLLFAATVCASAADAETPKVIQPGDVNGDGAINATDAVMLAQYLAGWDVVLGGDSHTVVIDAAVPASCTQTGLTEGKHCSDCGMILVKQQTVPTIPHDFVETLVQPTTATQGYTLCKCKVCGYEQKKDFIPPVNSNGLAVEVNTANKTCVITGIGTCTDTDINIPAKISDYTVVGIADKAFSEQTQITSIQLPNTVKTLGKRAFYGCTGLTEFTVTASVTSIGHQIFYKCDNLATVYYNSSFSPDLDKVFLNIPSIKTVVFGGTSVPYRICYNCTNIEKVEILDSVKYIGDPYSYSNSYSFYGCTSLKEVTIGASVTSIGSYAFYNCSSLTNLYISDLESWLNVELVYDSHPLSSAGGNLYIDGVLATDIAIPDSVTSIGNYAFLGFSSLTSVEIPDSVTSIGYYAFEDCSSLTSVEIPDSVTSIGKYAFEYCSSLTSLYISDLESWLNVSLSDYSSHPLYSAGGNLYIDGVLATDIEIPDTVTSISFCAFYNCDSLTSVEIPDSVTSIGWDAFWGCSSLTNVEIPDSVTSIGNYAFSGCSNLTSVYYGGDATKWAAISFGSDLWYDTPSSSKVYYYSATQPTTSGNYWHYVDGKPTPW